MLFPAGVRPRLSAGAGQLSIIWSLGPYWLRLTMLIAGCSSSTRGGVPLCAALVGTDRHIVGAWLWRTSVCGRTQAALGIAAWPRSRHSGSLASFSSTRCWI